MITELTWQQAEAQFSKRLDRRRKYATDGEELLELSRWTQACSGCTEVEEYCRLPEAGSGCRECAYHGRVMVSMWLPQSQLETARKYSL